MAEDQPRGQTAKRSPVIGSTANRTDLDTIASPMTGFTEESFVAVSGMVLVDTPPRMGTLWWANGRMENSNQAL